MNAGHGKKMLLGLILSLMAWSGVAVTQPSGVPVVFDANGSPVALWRSGTESAQVLSEKNVMFTIQLLTGQVTGGGYNYYACEMDNEPNFEQLDCTGTMSFRPTNPVGSRCGGVLIRVAPGNLMYSAFSSIATERIVRSRSPSPGQCINFPSPQLFVTVEFLPNDPAVTGVSNANYPAPLTIALPSSVNCMFRDGFEICQ